MPNHIFFSEVIGTGLLILLGDGVVAGVLLSKSKAENSGWIVITFGWAMAVAMAVYAVGQFDGAHLNPAVTLGLAVIGVTDWSNVPSYIGGELVGAFIGAVLVWAHYSHHWKETEDPGLKLAVFSHRPGDPQPSVQLHQRVHRDLRARLRRRRHHLRRATAWSVDSPRCSSACWSSRSASRWVVRPDTRSTQPATSCRASPTSSSRSRARARPTGSTPGYRWWDRSSAASSAPSLRTSFPSRTRR